MDFLEFENQDGIRLSWNNFPNNKHIQTKCVVPIATLYSPLRETDQIAYVEYDPQMCKCGAMLNPYCQVDFHSKIWLCQFCGMRNQFPKHYADNISQQNLPAELHQEYSTIEYVSQTKPVQPNIFLFVIDTCITEEELESVKDSIQQSLNIIPQDSIVGLITFGKFIFIHELGFSECPKSYALNGAKDYTPQQIQQMLGIQVHNDPRGVGGQILKKFLLPLSECEFQFNSIIDDLQPDPWVPAHDERAARATGTALNTAISLLETFALQGSKLMLFLGGPCTIGPGQIVDAKLDYTIRVYYDIEKDNDNCKYMNKAIKYYQQLTQRAIKNQQTIYIFAFTLEQFGLYEMKSLVEKTGGYIIEQESFESDIFKESYRKVFEQDDNGNLKQGVSGKIDTFVSRDLKVCGAIGPCTSLKKSGPAVSDFEIGQGGTTSWYLGGIDQCTTIGFYYEVNADAGKKIPAGKVASIQYQTVFRHSSGQIHLRVTTIARKFTDDKNVQELAHGFDQEAACTIMARLGIFKSENEDHTEILKWLDRSLIRLMAKFASYMPNQPNTFKMPTEFQFYPQFMFHLRRSPFLQVFGMSPDEAGFYRSTLLRENTTNAIVMIQPALQQYSFDSLEPIPVQLSQDSLRSDVILLLDSYFKVVIWHGEQIKQWKEANYQEQEEYAHFKDLLEAPDEDAKYLFESRFPVPWVIRSYQGDGLERHIKSKVSPSGADSSTQGENYLNDDASFKLFMDSLIKLVVTQNN